MAEEIATLRQKAVLAPARWTWARQWEFWLVVTLGAALRLWRLDLTQYLDDQTRLMTLARASVTRGLIPLTGIPSSIHTLNPPLTIYPLLPFAAFTADPMPVVISVALWNGLGVALCYIFTLRYFGRRVATYSGLLFASCGAAINYSRFIWQQNYLPTLLILWALTLYMGCVERRRWFVANVTLLSLAALLHPVSALLAPVTLVAAILAPRVPRWREWVYSALIIALLAAPTLLWEVLSGFSDVRAARTYALGHSHITPAVFYYLYLALGSPDAGFPATKIPFLALNVIAAILFAVGWLVLTVRILRPARALPWRRESGIVASTRTWLVALYHGLRASAPWKINVLLWLSVTLPVALMIRHSAALFAHYLMVLYPTAFIVSGIGVVAAIQWIARQMRAFSPRVVTIGALALQVSMALLIVARSAQWVSYPASLTNTATFSAYANYGYPLSVIESGAAQLDALQRRNGAAMVETLTPSDARYRLPATYIFAGDRSDHVTLTAACLLLPSPTETSPWLITSTVAGSPSASLLASLPGATRAGSLSMTGGPDYPVFLVSGDNTAVSGAQAAGPVYFDDGFGDSLELTSLFRLSGGELIAGWTVVAARSADAQTRYFTIAVHTQAGGVTVSCESQRWQAGETLYTGLPVAQGAGDVRLKLTTGTDGLDIRTVGGLRFLSALDSGEAPTQMKPEVSLDGSTPLLVTLNGDGSVTYAP